MSVAEVFCEQEAKSFWRGHPIAHRNGGWVYEDTLEPTGPFGGDVRPCAKCGVTGRLAFDDRGDNPDPCIGRLPGVVGACCGHGVPGEGYIIFENGVHIRCSIDEIVIPPVAEPAPQEPAE